MEEENRCAVRTRYERCLDACVHELADVTRKIRLISTVRVIWFVCLLVGLYLCRHMGGGWLLVAGLLACVPFVVLIKRHSRLFERRSWLEASIRVYQDELKALELDFSSFADGKEWQDPSHDYSFDLDVFGKHSLYQYLNRTCTRLGGMRLADWLQNPLLRQEDIEMRQECVRLLAGKPDFREQFRINGLLRSENPDAVKVINAWLQGVDAFCGRWLVKGLIVGVPVVNLILIVSALLGYLPGSLAFGGFVLFLFGSLFFQRRITLMQVDYERVLNMLKTQTEQLKLIERSEVWFAEGAERSVYWDGLTQRLRVDGTIASIAVSQLATYLDTLDKRGNVLVSAVLDGLYMWQLRQAVRIETWRRLYGKELAAWLEVVGEVDALCSLGTYAYNNPEARYPSVEAQPFRLCIKQMKHPLMGRDVCVPNDVLQPHRPYFMVVTGANMAGKSTYLRTLGVNYLLAAVGAPVLCEQMSFYPAKLITSLRTSDSLANNESYFFAELKRLKYMLNRLEQGEEVFIILDEILKGTNSIDKQKGSLALVKRLMELKTNGVIATHDLLLATLTAHFPGNMENTCFEADMAGDSLTFTYKMQSGVAKNMNACFLMRKMGLEIDDAETDKTTGKGM